MAGIGCTGNIIVLLGRHFAPSNNIVHSLYLKNLALSDLLMGIYLLIIAAEDQYYRGVYLTYQYIWRHSNMCKLCGNVLMFFDFHLYISKNFITEFLFFRIFKYPIMWIICASTHAGNMGQICFSHSTVSKKPAFKKNSCSILAVSMVRSNYSCSSTNHTFFTRLLR